MKVYVIEFGFGKKIERVEKKFKTFLEAHLWTEEQAKLKGCTSSTVYDKAACYM